MTKIARGALALLLAVLLFAVGGCGNVVRSEGPDVDKLLNAPNSDAGGDKIVLRLWSFHQAMEYDFWQWLAKEYEKEHPQVEIRVEYVSSDDYFSSTRLLSALASGQGPDIFFVSPATIKRFVDADYLYPLTDYFTPEIRSDFNPVALDSVTVANNIYAVPFETELLGLFYNEDMFKSHGLQPPKTWDDMMKAARILKSPGVTGLTIETYDGVFQNFSWLPFLWQTGSDLLSEDGRSSALTGSRAKSMYAFFRSMVEQGLINLRPSRPTTDIGILASGETAMQVSGSWNIRMLETEFKDQPIGVVPLPLPEGGAPVTISGGWKMAANRQSEHAEEAAKFIMWAFAGKPEIPLKWVSETKFAYSPRKSVMEAGQDFYRKGLREVFTDQIYGTERAEPRLPEDINRIFSDSLQQLLFGTATPEEIVRKADQRIQSSLDASLK
ncbi:ABC transporter substrate-binding protein [Cohnella candidum]|uniref:ABC transporter substrate-binding protein n=1 Tax=Cohnella candidum TaxID=2674991 RepID=A0A3G3JYY5_9BACL|nr:ABC transporter substrate-binding protein [Cohnella candidum]AYQ73466.1 ABC transporter substrate-binding protein [Cohnella candidum]